MDDDARLMKLFMEEVDEELQRLKGEEAAVPKQPQQPQRPKLKVEGGRTTWEDLAIFIDPVQWDWPGWLPRGFLTILASEPGMGKSLLCMRLAASYIAGWDWPDGRPFSKEPASGQTGEVIWCEGEASQALNLERARSWGLPLKHFVFPLNNPISPFRLDDETHMVGLLHLCRDPNVRLVVLDSLSSLVKKGSIPEALYNLGEFARITGQPILLTHHLRKGRQFDWEGGVDLERLRGTSRIAQLARVVWALDAPDMTDPEHRRLAVTKNNLMLSPAPIGLRIDDQGLHFGQPPQPTANHQQPSQLEIAANFLLDLLANGPVPYPHIIEAGQQAGITEGTLRRAKKHLSIPSQRLPHQNQTIWAWHLPDA